MSPAGTETLVDERGRKYLIDHGEPRPLDEVLVELANGEERTVRRDELTSVFDVKSTKNRVAVRRIFS